MRKLGLGWKPDIPDRRDFIHEPEKVRRLPSSFDLSERFFTVWNQRSLGSCTAHTVAAASLFLDLTDRDMSIVLPSRHFIYYNTRLIEGTVDTDAGAEIRSAIKSVSKFGYPSEEQEPYRIREFSEKPRASSYRSALKERVKRYERVERKLPHFRSLIYSGYPVAIGFTCYESIYSEATTSTGLVRLPKGREKVEGGHAVLVVGYDDKRGCLIFRNSWGSGWGRRGYGILPYEYIEDSGLSDDFWVLLR